MPYCKHCHQKISRFDTDICPTCGQKKPIEEGYQTMDITKTLPTMEETDLPSAKKRRTYCFLFLFLGAFGAHYFYIGKPWKAILCLLLTLAGVLGIGLPLYLCLWHSPILFILLFALVYIGFALTSIPSFHNLTIVDRNGEFLR